MWEGGKGGGRGLWEREGVVRVESVGGGRE